MNFSSCEKNLFFITQTNEIVCWNINENTEIFNKLNFKTADINCFKIIKDKKIVIGCEDGLYLCDCGLKEYEKIDSLKINRIWIIKDDIICVFSN